MELKNSSTTNPRVIQGGLKLDIDQHFFYTLHNYILK